MLEIEAQEDQMPHKFQIYERTVARGHEELSVGQVVKACSEDRDAVVAVFTALLDVGHSIRVGLRHMNK